MAEAGSLLTIRGMAGAAGALAKRITAKRGLLQRAP
jgi:hypothetical protein